MSAPTSTTLRRVRGCVAGGLSGATSIVAHSLAGGGEPPSGSSIALLVMACAAFGAAVSAITIDRGALPGLLTIILAGQAVGHTTLMLGAHHGHLGLLGSLSPGMVTFHAATAVLDVALIRLAESAAVWALSLLRRLRLVEVVPALPVARMWVVAPTPAGIPHGLLLASAAVTRGPPSVPISH